MNALSCACPVTGTLKTFTKDNCKYTLSQIAKLAFARKGFQRFDDLNAAVPGTSGLPTPPGDQQAMLLADWQAYMAATDSSKIIVTPLVGGNPTMTAGEAQTFGGNDNTTLNGKQIITGYSDATIAMDYYYLSPEVATEFGALQCEDLAVYLILTSGEIVGKKGIINGNTPPAPTIEGFDVESYMFGGVDFQGIGDVNKHNLTIQLANDWFSNAIKFKPTWNPLTAL